MVSFFMRNRLIFVFFICWLLAGCAEPRSVVVDFLVDSVAEAQAALVLRLPDGRDLAATMKPEGLWEEFPLAEDRIAVVGFKADRGPWWVPYVYLAGLTPGRNQPPLEPETYKRLARFLRHARASQAVQQAPSADRKTVLAAHATRSLAVEIVAKRKVNVTFVRYDARAPGLTAYCADGVRDLVLLVGSRGAVLVRVTDERDSRWIGYQAAASSLSPASSREEIVAALMTGS